MRKLTAISLLILLIVSLVPMATTSAQFAGCASEEEQANGFHLFATELNGVQIEVSVVGIDDFDPAITLLDEEGNIAGCSNDADGAAELSFTLPSIDEEQVAGPSELSASVGFSIESDERRTYEIIVTGNDDSTGEFVLILEGASIFPAVDNDYYILETTQAMNDAEVPMAIYAANLRLPENPLNPGIKVSIEDVFEQECKASSSQTLCEGDSEDLTGFTVTRDADSDPIELTGNDAYLRFVAGGDEPIELSLEVNSSSNTSTGPYALIIHSGVGGAEEEE